jgi:hypothetical protein
MSAVNGELPEDHPTRRERELKEIAMTRRLSVRGLVFLAGGCRLRVH